MATTNKRASFFGVALAAALLFFAGCVDSDTAVLAESDQVKVPDLSGTYTAAEDLADKVTVVWKQNNVFSVKQDDDPEEEGILVPLNAPDAYLLQLKDSDGAGYLLVPLLVKDGEIMISTLATSTQSGTTDGIEAAQKNMELKFAAIHSSTSPRRKLSSPFSVLASSSRISSLRWMY